MSSCVACWLGTYYQNIDLSERDRGDLTGLATRGIIDDLDIPE
jgi:hypothetical protein